MKTNAYVQYSGKEVQLADLENKIKALWKTQGNLAKDLKTIDAYINVDENKCYYVINDTVSGNLPIEG